VETSQLAFRGRVARPFPRSTNGRVLALSPEFPLGDSLEVFIRREDAERFIEEVRGDDPRLPRSSGSISGSLRRMR
jgi:hypothetical protein